MASAFHGTPCLVPAQFSVDGGESRRGFITRLSSVAAALSSDPALQVGTTIKLSFKRPSDSVELSIEAVVREHLSEGGLWRGSPAALVAFAAAVELEEGDHGDAALELPEPFGAPMAEDLRGDDGPITDEAIQPPSHHDEPGTLPRLGTSLRPGGLGPRRPAGRLRRSRTVPSTRSRDELPPVQTDSSRAISTDDSAQLSHAARIATEASIQRALTQGFFDDPSGGMQVGEESAGSTFEVAEQLDQSFAAWFSDDATVPPSTLTDSHEGIDDADFISRFGGPVSMPPQELFEEPGGEEPSSEPRSLPDHAIAPHSVPHAEMSPRPTRLGNQRQPAPSAGVQRLSEPAAAAPWDDLEQVEVASLIPRNARIASTLDVHFWARGRRNPAVADNFSREGLFLTYSGTPPVRGAIVRVEFPLQGDDESVPVRFNAEVRWHRSDRPGVGLPEGFGVQILTFETPKDRARYLELLEAILSLGPANAGVEDGFSWGRPGR